MNGLTPLHCAALEGNLHTTEILLKLGADPWIQNKNLQYPIFSALSLPILHDEQLKQNKVNIDRLLLGKNDSI